MWQAQTRSSNAKALALITCVYLLADLELHCVCSRFSKTEDVASNTAIKSSHQRGIRSKLLEQMPLLAQPGGSSTSYDPEAEPPTLLEVLWPKKEAPALIKWYA